MPLLLLAGAFIVAAIVVIAVVMIRQRRHRSAAVLGALLIAGLLLVSPALPASSAQAAAGQEDCVPAPAKPAKPAKPVDDAPAIPTEPEGPEAPVAPTPVTLVTPVSPHLSDVPCGTAPEVIDPTVAGVIYERTVQGEQVTITATPAKGYAFPSGAVTTWTLSVAVTPCPCASTPIDWEDNRTDGRIFSNTALADGRTQWTVSAIPADWARPGVTFAYSVSGSYFAEIRWTVPAGEALPDGLTSDWTRFSHSELVRSAGAIRGGIVEGEYRIEDSQTNVEAQVIRARDELQAKYPGIHLGYEVGANNVAQVVKLLVTAPVDTCGEVESREYVSRMGGIIS